MIWEACALIVKRHHENPLGNSKKYHVKLINALLIVEHIVHNLMRHGANYFVDIMRIHKNGFYPGYKDFPLNHLIEHILIVRGISYDNTSVDRVSSTLNMPFFEKNNPSTLEFESSAIFFEQ
jgi:hypothetical protein